jgi:hypothetical protein
MVWYGHGMSLMVSTNWSLLIVPLVVVDCLVAIRHQLPPSPPRARALPPPAGFDEKMITIGRRLLVARATSSNSDYGDGDLAREAGCRYRPTWQTSDWKSRQRV